MTQAEAPIRNICPTDAIGHDEERVTVLTNRTALLRVIVTLDRGCQEWLAGETASSVQHVINDISRAGDIIIYTDWVCLER